MQLAFKWSQLKIYQNQKVNKKKYIAIFNQINSMFLVSNFWWIYTNIQISSPICTVKVLIFVNELNWELFIFQDFSKFVNVVPKRAWMMEYNCPRRRYIYIFTKLFLLPYTLIDGIIKHSFFVCTFKVILRY